MSPIVEEEKEDVQGGVQEDAQEDVQEDVLDVKDVLRAEQTMDAVVDVLCVRHV